MAMKRNVKALLCGKIMLALFALDDDPFYETRIK